MHPATSLRARWAAIGAAVAVTVGAGIAATDVVDATVSSGERTVLVAITPCRLFDTRPEFQVGPKSTPLGANETVTLNGRGAVGNCSLPDDATALSLNVTAVGATLPTFLTIWPTGATMPTASSLNPFPDSPPAPNAVTVDLSDDGRFDVYNLQGQVHVLADVVGYYVHHTHDDLYDTRAQVDAELAGLRAEIAAVQAEFDGLEAEVDGLEAKLASMTVTKVDGQPTVRFSGVNVQIVDGTRNTPCGSPGFEACNGRGNLIIGYHEDPDSAESRSGSHNLALGADNDYTSYAGIVAGSGNTVSGPYASITGGNDNAARGRNSSISGGRNNQADGAWSSVTGGSDHDADGDYSSITGGQGNDADGDYASITGGLYGTASGDYSSITSGYISAASGDHASVNGGRQNVASGPYASVSGGMNNDAGGTYSSVSGGNNRDVSGRHDWRAGDLFQDS